MDHSGTYPVQTGTPRMSSPSYVSCPAESLGDVSLEDVREVFDLLAEPNPSYDAPSLSPDSDGSSSSSNSCSGEKPVKMCGVCGDRPAGRHCYYGGKVCNSCRAFFRRAVQSDKFSKFSCRKSDKCSINSKSWKSCQKCRFKKCLESGMKPTWVIHSLNHASPVNLRLDAPSGENKNMLTFVSEPSQSFTLNDRLFLEGLFHTLYTKFVERTMLAYSKDRGCFDNILTSFKNDQPVSLRSRNYIENVLTGEASCLSTMIQPTSEVCEQDLEVLYSMNYPLLLDLWRANVYDSKASCNKYFKKSVNVILGLAESRPEIGEAVQRLSMYEMRSKQDFAPHSYDNMYPAPWALNTEAEGRHRELTQCMGAWFRFGGKEPDDIEVVLALLVTLFSSEKLHLVNGKAVDKVQTMYTHLLYRYLKEKYPKKDAMSKYCNALLLPSLAREAYEIRKTRLPVFDAIEVEEVTN